MKSTAIAQDDTTVSPRSVVRGVAKTVFQCVAGSAISLGLVFGVLVNASYFYDLHEREKPSSSEPGIPHSKEFVDALLALPDAGERMADARLGYASQRYNEVEMLVNIYRLSPGVMADYYSVLARRVTKECRYGVASLCPAPVKNSVVSAFEFYHASIAYQKWQITRALALQNALTDDPAFSQIRAQWPDLSRAQKLQTLRYITAMQVAAYSDDTLRLSAPRVYEAVLPPNTGGNYNPRTNIIQVCPDVLNVYSFDQAMQLIGHEGGHRVHAGLVQLSRTKQGQRYLRAQGIEDDVRMLALSLTTLNMDRYDSKGDIGSTHGFLPDERDADDIGINLSLATQNAQAGMMAPRVPANRPFTFRLAVL